MLDSTVVTLAIPQIQEHLDASNAALQWTVNGYLLTLAIFVVTGGRLGDLYGRKKVFLISLALFFIGSIVSATATSSSMLIIGRLIQGIGGAGMITLSLAIVSNSFSEEERPKALGIWTGISALALAAGPLVGGFLIESFSWRWIFWINVPIAAIGALIIARFALESVDESAQQKLDIKGLLTFSLGVSGVIVALIQAKSWGVVSALTAISFFGGILFLYLFWRIEHRVSNPIVEFDLFRNKPYLGANAAAFGIVFCYWSVMFFFPQYFQNILEYDPLLSGVLILPTTVPMIFISPFGGKLVKRFGTRKIMTSGMLLATIGVLWLTRLTTTSDYISILPGFLFIGVALGLVYAPMSTAAMSAMPRAKAGIAAGVLAMNRMVSGAVGLALVGGIFLHLESSKRNELAADAAPSLSKSEINDLDGLLAGSDAARKTLDSQSESTFSRVEDALRETFTFALSNALWILVVVAAISGLLTWLYVEERKHEEKLEDHERANPDHHGLRHRFHL